MHYFLFYFHDCAAATAVPKSPADPVPPISGVSRLQCPAAGTVSIAFTIASLVAACRRCSSIMAPHQICPTGLVLPSPVISGAEPWTGSKRPEKLRSGLILADGAMPIMPVQAGPESERISPNKLLATTTSNLSGGSTKCALKISMRYFER